MHKLSLCPEWVLDVRVESNSCAEVGSVCRSRQGSTAGDAHIRLTTPGLTWINIPALIGWNDHIRARCWNCSWLVSRMVATLATGCHSELHQWRTSHSRSNTIFSHSLPPSFTSTVHIKIKPKYRIEKNKIRQLLSGQRPPLVRDTTGYSVLIGDSDSDSDCHIEIISASTG